VIAPAELRALDAQVDDALARGDRGALRVLGHGEISVVLGWPADRPRVAVKRLPPFPDRARFEAYGATQALYLRELGAAGIEVAPTELCAVDRRDGTVAGYCVQRAIAPEALVPRRLRRERPSPAHPLVRALVESAARVPGPRIGLDAQVSNWAEEGGRLLYLDVTTPLLAREDGESALDPAVFLAAFPWALRWAIRRLVLPGIRRRYHTRRTVLLDLCANLLKERLEPWVPAFLAAANAHIEAPLDEREVRADYRRDARTWAAMLALRRADRWWQCTIRRRGYPFLLPEAVAR
jgi:hypothetical protein